MNPWIQITGWTLIHFVWQGGLLAVATALALWLCRRRSSNLQYAIACTGLAAMLAAPVATAAFLLDARSIWLPARNAYPASAGFEAPVAGVPLPVNEESADAAGATATRIDALLPSLVSAWLGGVALLLARFSGGWWRVRRLRVASRLHPVSAWQSAAERLAGRLRVDATFRVVESTLVDAPAVVGWIRPIILLPVAVLTNLTPKQIEVLVAHELAHIRRRDYAVNLCQALAESVLFFHPGVWWISARLREVREECCDDEAVEICGEPHVYAEALAELASWRTREVLAPGAANGSLLRRIQRLVRVSEHDEPKAVGGLAVLTSSVALAVGIAFLAPGSPVSAQPTPSMTAQAAETRRIRTTEHFEVHYPPDLDLHPERFVAEAERAYEQVSGDLRHTVASKVPIVLYRTTGELENSAQPSWQRHAGPYIDPSRDRILFPLDHPVDQWLGLITHEVTHIFAFDIIPGTSTPQWIAEGLAEYERAAWDPNDLVALRDAVRDNRIPQLGGNQGGDAGTDRRLVYAIGHAAFEFIESRWGKSGVRQFLFAVRRIALAGTGRYDGAFQVSGREFDRDFERYLKERFSRAVDRSPAGRFDFAASVQVEGEITALNFPAADGLACMELWVAAEGDRRRRWAVECGGASQDLLRALKPGDRVIVTGAPARKPATQRIIVQSLERPLDGFSWRARSG